MQSPIKIPKLLFTELENNPQNHMETEMTPNRKSTSNVIITPKFKLYYRAVVNNQSHSTGTKQACIAKGWN